MSTIEHLVPITPARLLLPSGAREYIACPEGASVAELCAQVPEPVRHMVHVFINGTLVADWEGTRLQAGDNVLLAVVPAGGGGSGKGKGILGAVLTIAVAVFAPYAAGFFGAAGSTSYIVAQAAITMIGTMVVGALVKPPTISTAGPEQRGVGASQSYSLSGQSNAMRPFGACMVVYGRHKVMPTLANNVDVNNVSTSSILSALYDFGLGRVNISDLRIGDVPIEQYTPELRLLQDSTGADLVLTAQSVGYDQYALVMHQNDPIVVRTKLETITATLVIQFPRGLFQAMPRYGAAAFTADFRTFWRPVGSPTWQELPAEAYLGAARQYATPPVGLQWATHPSGTFKDYVPPDSSVELRQFANDVRVAGGGAPDAAYAMYRDAQRNPNRVFSYPDGPMDEAAYFARNPDVLNVGWYRSAKEHFEIIGSREGRDPGVRVFVTGIPGSGQWDPFSSAGYLHYLDFSEFPDNQYIGAWGWIRNGFSTSATLANPVASWQSVGGFVFSEATYLARYPDVAALVAAGNYASGWAHFVAAGSYQGRNPYADADGSVRITAALASPFNINVLLHFETPGEYEVMTYRTDKIEDGTDQSIIQTSGGEVSARYNESTVVLLKSGAHSQPVKARLHHTFLEMRIQASEQLQGVVQNLSAVAISVLRVTADGETFTWQESRNPAWIALDILTSERNPRPLSNAQIDWPSWVHLAQVCDTLRSYTYNGRPYTGLRYTCDTVVTEMLTVRDLVESVLSVCRASLILTNAGKWGVLHDEEKVLPRQLITPANSWGFTGTRTFSNQPHALHVNFINNERGWVKDEATVYADGYDADNSENFETLDTFGITDYPHAWAFGRYMLAQGLLRSELFTVSMDVENLLVQRGDLVYVAHDVPMVGGAPTRVSAVSGETVYANLPLATVPTGYCVRLSDGAIRTGAVVDVPAQGVFVLDSGEGIEPDDLIVLGEFSRQTQPYLVQRITPGADLAAELTLCRYVREVYDADVGALPEYDPGFGGDNLYGTDLACHDGASAQVLYYVQREPRVDVTLTWQTSGSFLHHHELVLVYQDGRRTMLDADLKTNLYTWTLDALRQRQYFGVPLVFEVTPVSDLGLRGVPCLMSITLVLDTDAPPPVPSFGVNVQKETVDLTWTLPEAPDISDFQLRYTPEAVAPSWEAAQQLASIGWPTTKVAAGARTGSYGIRVRDTSGNYSDVVWRRTTVAVLPEINVITVLNDRDLSWPGLTSHVVVDGPTVQSEGDYGNIYPTGIYYCSLPVDLGQVYEVRVASKLMAHGEMADDVMASWASLADVEALGQELSDLWDCWLEVRTSDGAQTMLSDWASLSTVDSMAVGSGSGWSPWRHCTVGDYTAQLLQFRFVLSSFNTGVRVVLSSGRIDVDMPDRVDTFGDVDVPAAGLDFVFPVAFRHLESVAVSINGNSNPVREVITAKQRTGFHIALRNTQTGVDVAGSVDIMAEGYGRERLSSI